MPETSNSSYGTGFGITGAGEELDLGDVLLIRTSHQNLRPGNLKEFQQIVEEGPSIYRGSHKMFIQEIRMNIPEELAYKHQRTAFARSSCKELLRMIPAESPQDLPKRTCMRSCKDLLEDFTRISTRGSNK